MTLESDVAPAERKLFVEFFVHDRDPYKGFDFIRKMVPGDKTNIIERPVRESDKKEFPQHWLHFQMMNGGPVIGTALSDWHKAAPDDFNSNQLDEMLALKFQTVEQLAGASDSQLQRIGMGGLALRERARQWLTFKNRSAGNAEHEATRRELDELKAQMAELLGKRGPGRPRKEGVTDDDHASTGPASN